MRSLKTLATLSAIGIAGLLPAPAGLFLNFEDLSGTAAIAQGYNGFTWGGNWQVATASGNTYVYTADGNGSIARANGGLFSLESTDFASSGSGNVTVAGYVGTTLVGTYASSSLSSVFSTLATPNLANIDRLVFSGANWSMDSFADSVALPVPEPATMIAGALLLLPFGASTIRILRKNRTA